jgi:hypothetical protein
MTAVVTNVSQPMARDSGGVQLFGDLWCGVVEEHRDVVVVAELAGGGEGAEADRVEVGDVVQVEDQSQGPEAAHGVDQGTALLDRVRGVQDTVGLDDQRAIRAGVDIDRRTGHRFTFRSPDLSERLG